MGDFESCRRRDVAARVGVGFDGGSPFVVDGAACGVEIGFPTGFDVVAHEGADVFVHDAFPLAADFGCVFGAGGADDLGDFFQAPVDASDPPAAFDVLEAVVDDAGEAHCDGEVSDRVDDGGKEDAHREICRRENPDGGSVRGGHEGSLDGERSRDGDDVGQCGRRFRVKEVIDVAEDTAGSGWDMAGDEVGEWKGMEAVPEVVRLREEFPGEEDGVFGAAVGTIFDDGFFEVDASEEMHVEGLQDDLWISDREQE